MRHHVGAELTLLLRRGGTTNAGLVEDACGFGVAGEHIKAVGETVIAQARTDGVKIVHAFFQRSKEAGQGVGGHAGGRGQFIGPAVERFGIVYAPGFIRAKGRVHLGANAERGNGFMLVQRIHGIICGAQGAHIELFQNAVHG